MIIAVDVDGVLAEQAVPTLETARKEMGVVMTKEQVTERNILVGGIPFGKLIATYMTRPEWVKSMPMVPGAQKGFAELRKRAQILVATSIPEEAEEPRREWLSRNFGYNGPAINTLRQGKAGIRADVMIDDYPANLEDFVAAAEHRRGILMLRPSNREYAANIKVERISVAASWAQVLSIVDQFVCSQKPNLAARTSETTKG